MAKSIDKVLQPDGTYKWELVEPTHDEMMGDDPVTACPAPVVEPEPETVVITKEPLVEKTTDFESMTKKQLEAFGRTIGIELDRRHNKADLIAQLENFTSAN